MFRELEERDAIFDLPRRKFFTGLPPKDVGTCFHGRPAGTPLGPAAGPQSQMAQNIVLSWLAGSRILELKTVQIDDELQIPRPCIDMATVGFNVEWSQELKLEQSLEEYVKGAMLVEMLRASGVVGAAGDAELGTTLYDISVGYDLAGIQSARVRAFLEGMLDCSGIVDRLRAEIPERWRHLRDLDFPTRLSETQTLSTFHGCPPDEIERIIEHLQDAYGLASVVKLNPMLLGPARARELLHDDLGYRDLVVPDSAFERDTRWEQAVEFVERLGQRADRLGLGFGVKFTNTLIVENHRDFFPADQGEMYLSGPPLHVLAIELVARFRAVFGDRFPVSFSAGVARKNFPDGVALGLVPITVCSDWLGPGGYGRGKGYFDELAARMDGVAATGLDDFVIRAYGLGGDALERLGLAPDDPRLATCRAALDRGEDLRAAAGDALFARWRSEALLANTALYAAAVVSDRRYHAEQNAKPPKKIGSELELFDCITCDKCVPVCPNDANFTFALPREPIPIEVLRLDRGRWSRRVEGELAIDEKHQIGNFADFCNECGNCDVFCPEDGGPYVVKPRFFGSLDDWRAFDSLDGFFIGGTSDEPVVHARSDRREFVVVLGRGAHRYRGDGFDVALPIEGPLDPVSGTATREIDLTWYRIARLVAESVIALGPATYVAPHGGR